MAAVRATEPLFGLFLKQLLTNGFGFFGEFRRIRFRRLSYPPVHLFSFNLLLTGTERGLSFNHLVDETTKAKKVGTKVVLFVVDYFGSCANNKKKTRETEK